MFKRRQKTQWNINPNPVNSLNTFICMMSRRAREFFHLRISVCVMRFALVWTSVWRVLWHANGHNMHAYIYRCLRIYRKRAQADCCMCWTNPQDTALAFTYFSPLLFWLTSRIGLVSAAYFATLSKGSSIPTAALSYCWLRFGLEITKKKSCVMCVTALARSFAVCRSSTIAVKTKRRRVTHKSHFKKAATKFVKCQTECTLRAEKEQKAASIRFEFYGRYCDIRIVPEELWRPKSVKLKIWAQSACTLKTIPH
jgi:hypothetical protein